MVNRQTDFVGYLRHQAYLKRQDQRGFDAKLLEDAADRIADLEQQVEHWLTHIDNERSV